jgi:hypothetical protein
MAFSPGMSPLQHSRRRALDGAEGDLTAVRMEILGVETE